MAEAGGMTETEGANGATTRSDYSRQQIFLVLFLLTFYCVPLIGSLIWGFTVLYITPSKTIDSDSLLFSVVSELGKNSGVYTNTIHQMIMPAIAAITAANTKIARPAGLSSWLFIVPLVTIFCCLTAALVFNIRSTMPPETLNAVSQYFIGSASNLSVYVMLLVGLRIREQQ